MNFKILSILLILSKSTFVLKWIPDYVQINTLNSMYFDNAGDFLKPFDEIV
jgi:hypothetical protein